ncbi:MAG: DEAD/DEAH box helicase [Treponema sp.]|jgi:ATP-dependent RNA helicase RhlB|nr:DEAD/DEAH box helicase [Treponema sp.]
MEFSAIQLHPDLQKGINEAGYITCMPVQEQVLTHAFNGQDLYVQSQTGTGKTAAFLIVIFQRLLVEPVLHGKKAIIMVPTRELAVQVEEEAKLLGKYLPFKIGSFFGGVGYTQQKDMLRDNVQVLIGTPGRVLDLNQSGQMNLMDIAFLVLDEADRMFDMGFYPDLRKLISVVPPADRRQTMLFSATLNSWVKNLAWEYTKTPYEIEIEPETVTVEEVEQVLYHVSSGDKMKLLMGIMAREKPESAIIFCNTKRYTEIVAKRMKMNGYETEFIIGDLPQVKRLKVIDDIKAGKLRYLVATDVAARGLDIEGLSLVVNYDLPNEAENYVHRIGRTARAGKTGKAITLASEQDVYQLPAIERYIGQKIPSETVTAEHLGEDESEGKRVYTEFYEDRGERARGPGRRKSGETGPGRAGGGGDRNRRKTGTTEDPGSRAKSPEAGRRTSGAGDLSKLSFDERMAVYKQKYHQAGPGAQAGEGGNRKGGGKNRPPEAGTAQNAKNRPGGEANSAGNEQQSAGNSRNRRGKGRGGQRRNAGQGRAGPAGAEKEKTAPAANGGSQKAPQKGILSKILGIFNKKK